MTAQEQIRQRVKLEVEQRKRAWIEAVIDDECLILACDLKPIAQEIMFGHGTFGEKLNRLQARMEEVANGIAQRVIGRIYRDACGWFDPS